ncbi:MAG: 2-hydroxyacid dehydrogenase [Bacteroidaceae bacterium]|nr:2-hydroxyacid dehydrogenase [Bacteroidaceae bacterium]
MAQKIAFFGTMPYDEDSFTEQNKNFGFELRFYKGNFNKNNIILTKNIDAVCIFVNDTADVDTLQLMSENGAKLLALRCAGFNNVDLDAAAKNKITVVRVPAYSPYAVAEYTVAMMLSLNRKIPRATWRTRDGNFSLHGLMGFDMHGKTAGIIGTGRIGKILMQILRGFGMNILAYDLHPDYNFARENNIVYVTLDELYHSADIISLHCPLTEQTKYLINDYTIGKMKDGVMIINTGRGQLLQTEALIEGLKSKKIGSAGLDVYEEEGNYFYRDRSDRFIADDVLARLLSFNNVIVTSHQAFFTHEAMDNIAQTTLQNIKDYFSHKPLINEVKK